MVAARDAKMRSNIGQKRYFGSSYNISDVCQDREMKQCRNKGTGHATVVSVPEITARELPIYLVRLDDGSEVFMKGGDWNSLQTEEERKEAAREKAECKRRGPITIGMTAAQALASCHGKPERVNRTVTGNSVHEQWVYGSVYVYLRDGVVISFQDSR